MMQILGQHSKSGSVSEDEDSEWAEQLWEPYRCECFCHKGSKDKNK